MLHSRNSAGPLPAVARRIAPFGTLVLLAAAAFAQEAPAPAAPAAPAKPAADALETEVDAIRRLTGVGAWKAAKTSIDKFFAAHTGSPQVLAYLPALESDLQRCLFRMSGPQPTPLQLLGRGATKYEPNSCRAEFAVTRYGEDAGWRAAGTAQFFDALFDGEVSVEMSGDTAYSTTILLGFDSETQGAYAFVPQRGDYGPEPTLYRLDPGGGEPVKLGRVGLIFNGGTTRSVRYAMSASGLSIDVEQPKDWGQSRHDARTFADTKYRRGFVAVRSWGTLDAKGLRITGKLDAMFAKRQIAEADARRFRDWQKANWNRETALPAWVIAAEKSTGAWAERVPPDCSTQMREHIAALQRAVFESPGKAREIKPFTGLFGATGDWQDALVAFAERRWADAEQSARAVMAAAPDFAPARVLAGRALLVRGEDEAGAALFDEARRLDPSFAPAYDGLALAALRSGDAARMQAALADGAAAGASTTLTAELRQTALRLARGPDWKKRFDSFSTNFVVSGDASLGVCNDVAKILEECVDVYGKQFRKRTSKTRARVRVFSGFASYAEYVSDLGADPTDTLGMYLPALRELCIWLHEDRAELSNTIRHEGFHQYLHDFVDEAPIWFNEGYAEYFGFSRRAHGKALVGQVGEDQAALAAALLPKFTPVDKLLVMEPAEFMEDAGVHYVEAWALIHLLREPKSPELKGLLDRYTDAILAGKSAKEAYDAVFSPVAAKLAAALSAHVAEMARQR